MTNQKYQIGRTSDNTRGQVHNHARFISPLRATDPNRGGPASAYRGQHLRIPNAGQYNERFLIGGPQRQGALAGSAYRIPHQNHNSEASALASSSQLAEHHASHTILPPLSPDRVRIPAPERGAFPLEHVKQLFHSKKAYVNRQRSRQRFYPRQPSPTYAFDGREPDTNQILGTIIHIRPY